MVYGSINSTMAAPNIAGNSTRFTTADDFMAGVDASTAFVGIVSCFDNEYNLSQRRRVAAKAKEAGSC